MNYFEYHERKHNGSEPVCRPSDLVEWPEMVVSESEMTADELLRFDLMRAELPEVLL
jgi:hypothetical protein